jgi:flagellar motor switch protein FliG
MSDTIVSNMSGAQKVATLLLSVATIDRDLVSRILNKFDARELSDVTNAVTNLGTIPPAQATQNIQNFLQRWEEGPALIGNPSQGQLFIQTAAERRPQSEPSPSATETIWQQCGHLPDGTLMTMIAAEAPQVAAFWLSRLAPQLASKVLASFEIEAAAKIINCMSRISIPRPEAIRFMENYIADVLATGTRSAIIGDAILIPVIANLDESQQDRLMNKMEVENPDLAASLRRYLFKLSDIENLDLSVRKKLFEQVRTEDLVLALSSVEASLKEACLQGLGSRMRRMVEQELSAQEAAPVMEVMKARQAIVSVALRMIQEGAIIR